MGLGTYRFILAALVVESHATGPLIRHTWPLNPGIWAVAGFFVLSGYVMRRHAETLSPGQFYLDRFLRIYPHFVLFYVLSFVAVYGLLNTPAPQLVSTPQGPAIGASLLVLPMAFANPILFGDAGKWISSTLIVPQAWSLGIEASYYLLLPFIARAPRMREMLFWTSLATFAASALNIIPPEYGYWWLPGTLWMFLLGYRLHDMSPTRIQSLGVCGLGIMVIAFALPFRQTPTVEVASGALIAAAVIARLAKAPASGHDTFLASMSYSLFLCHYIPIWLGASYLVIAVVSLGLAHLGAHLEMRIADFRRYIRARRLASQIPASAVT